jgi:hypothetical protein
MNDMKGRGAWWGALAISTLLAACGGGDDAPPADTTPPAATPLTCTQLAGMAIPAASIGLPSSGGAVSTAVVTAPSGSGATAIPEYCLVNGSISPVDSTAPKILFRVALPTVWNGKAVMFGGGGFNGTIPSVAGNVSTPDQPADAARTGYATFASDSGHQANAFACKMHPRSSTTRRFELRRRRDQEDTTPRSSRSTPAPPAP